MRNALIRSNAKHEAGHWVSGWELGRYSMDIVISIEAEGDSYCESIPHPDFEDIAAIRQHLSGRIINLISGAKAESLAGGEINHEIYKSLVSQFRGAWADYFIASELFRYFYRSLTENSRGTFAEEWKRLEEESERIVISNANFINSVADEVVKRASLHVGQIKLTQSEMISLYSSSK